MWIEAENSPEVIVVVAKSWKLPPWDGHSDVCAWEEFVYSVHNWWATLTVYSKGSMCCVAAVCAWVTDSADPNGVGASDLAHETEPNDLTAHLQS